MLMKIISGEKTIMSLSCQIVYGFRLISLKLIFIQTDQSEADFHECVSSVPTVPLLLVL